MGGWVREDAPTWSSSLVLSVTGCGWLRRKALAQPPCACAPWPAQAAPLSGGDDLCLRLQGCLGTAPKFTRQQQEAVRADLSRHTVKLAASSCQEAPPPPSGAAMQLSEGSLALMATLVEACGVDGGRLCIACLDASAPQIVRTLRADSCKTL